MEELRQDPRVVADGEIRFRFPDVFSAQMFDYSKGGLGARIPNTLELNTPVEMEIFQGKLLASGHVRWIKIENETVSIGIQFREGEQELIAKIKDWKGALT